MKASFFGDKGVTQLYHESTKRHQHAFLGVSKRTLQRHPKQHRADGNSWLGASEEHGSRDVWFGGLAQLVDLGGAVLKMVP